MSAMCAPRGGVRVAVKSVGSAENQHYYCLTQADDACRDSKNHKTTMI
jgi:hypothetical protein